MAKSLNNVQLIGNLGGKPESRFTPTGRQVSTISIATTRSWKSAEGETLSRTEWHRVEFWGNLAKIVNDYLDKGARVYVQGRLETDSFDSTKHPGEKVYRTKIVGLELIMLGGAKGEAPTGETLAADEPELAGVAAGESSEEEFPF